MYIFLTILLIAAMLATVAMLVRGLVIFLMNASNDVKGGDSGPSASALKSNKAMQYRILFQAIAVIIAVLILAVASSRP